MERDIEAIIGRQSRFHLQRKICSMASRAHRFPYGDTPLTGVHGGTANAAKRAIAESKRLQQMARDDARYAAWEARGKPPSPSVPRRTDRLRPRASTCFLLVEAQEGLCGICGQRLGDLVTIDHVVPLSRGGRNVGNRMAAHSACNSMKADRMPTKRELERLAKVNERLCGTVAQW